MEGWNVVVNPRTGRVIEGVLSLFGTWPLLPYFPQDTKKSILSYLFPVKTRAGNRKAMQTSPGKEQVPRQEKR